MYVCVCVCVCGIYSFMKCYCRCRFMYSLTVKIPSSSFTTSILCAALLYSHLLPFSYPILTPGSYQSVLHFYNFIISWMLYNWNQRVCKLLGFTVHLRNSLDVHQSCMLSTADFLKSLSLSSSITWYRCTSLFNYSTIERHLDCL